MEFRVLGPLQVTDGETPVEIGGAKQRAVLAVLVLRANEVVGSDRLIGQLWGDRPPRNAAGALHNHISRLRKTLGSDVLASREWGYVLRAPPEAIDLRRFEGLLVEAEPLPARERAEKLREALSLWRGPPLADLVREPALEHDILRLEELRVSIIERRIDADLEAGRTTELVGELETMVAENPLREHLRGQLILALYRAGRQAEALEVYRETRRVLAEELGLEPGPALRELERAILRQDPSLAALAPAELPVPGAAPAGRDRRRLIAGGLVGILALTAGLGVAFVLTLGDRSRAQEAVTTTSGVVTATHRSTGAEQPSTPHPAIPPTSATEPSATTATTTTVIVRQSVAPPPAATRTTTTPTMHRTQTHPVTETTSRTPRTSKPTQPVKPKPKPNPTPAPAELVTISDAFESDLVDPTIWHQIATGGDVAIAERDGRLEVTVGARAVPSGQYNVIDVHVGTQCTFSGDFDARVEYTLLEWPVGDNVFVGLMAFFADSGVGRMNSTQWGDQYSSWVVPNGGGVPLPETSGALRIARVGSVETTYFWHRGAWQTLASGVSRGAAVFGLDAMSDTKLPFGHQELKVAFDNFSVTGASPVCPPGSQPPAS